MRCGVRSALRRPYAHTRNARPHSPRSSTDVGGRVVIHAAHNVGMTYTAHTEPLALQDITDRLFSDETFEAVVSSTIEQISVSIPEVAQWERTSYELGAVLHGQAYSPTDVDREHPLQVSLSIFRHEESTEYISDVKIRRDGSQTPVGFDPSITDPAKMFQLPMNCGQLDTAATVMTLFHALTTAQQVNYSIARVTEWWS